MVKPGIVSEWAAQGVLGAGCGTVSLEAPGCVAQGAGQDPALAVWVAGEAMEEADGGGQSCS